MFETGFLGTDAPFYMDLITLYFALLPFLLGVGIFYAIRGNIDLHYKIQFRTFILTLLVIVVFEVGIRISGGYSEFMKGSNADPFWMLAFLIFHIFVAIISVVAWSALIYGAVKNYKLEHQSIPKYHKKIGKLVFLGLSATSIMGVMIYFFLFIYQ